MAQKWLNLQTLVLQERQGLDLHTQTMFQQDGEKKQEMMLID